MSRAAASLALALLAGCTMAGAAVCDVDDDCPSGLLCANTHECLGASQVRRLTVAWTVGGLPAAAASCEPVGPLTLRIDTADRADEVEYAPVPCAVGQFTFDKLPVDFARVRLDGATGSRQASIGDADRVTVDLPGLP